MTLVRSSYIVVFAPIGEFLSMQTHQLLQLSLINYKNIIKTSYLDLHF